ncbi:MAG: methyltransferase domain-containing protein, partial [Verrucomicrobia bacterium]|nr:methyltransferase domain-containing protein [Verrucomicrobiota bacterium]
MDVDAINQDFYNSSGDSFDKIPFEAVLPQLIAKYHRGKTVLDVGSGPGALASWMASQGNEVVCIEPAAKPAEQAKKKGLTVHCTTIQKFSSDQHFDSILAISSLIHVPKEQLPSQIQKIAKLLNPGGTFFVSLIV